ncbi:MAG: hypothetical protein E7338_00235 [Clostridiales bacterium]|nr:hypothetical protein [Clostridiales bacterium]
MNISSRTKGILCLLLCFVILFCAAGVLFLNEENAKVYAENALTPSDSMTSSNEYGLYSTVLDVENEIKNNVKARVKANYNAWLVNIENMSPNPGLTISIPNYNQTTLNSVFNGNTTTYTGTCTIVAMVEVLEALSALCDDEYDLSESTNDRFANLMYYSLQAGNEYSSTNPGTHYETFAPIMSNYLHSKLPEVNMAYYQMPYSYNEAIGVSGFASIEYVNANTVVPLSILSIENYNGTEAHSMALSGVIDYTVNYRYFPQKGPNVLSGIAGTMHYTIFIVCDGHTDSSNGQFGSNYKYVVMDYNVSLYIFTFHWDYLVTGLSF